MQRSARWPLFTAAGAPSAAEAGDDPVAAAWGLRQRASPRALELLARHLPRDDGERTRAALVRAEVHWLRGELDAARAQLDKARTVAVAAGDDLALSDAELLDALVRADAGDRPGVQQALGRALEHAASAGCRVRAVHAQLALAFERAVRDPLAAREEHEDDVRARLAEGEPAWQMIGEAFLAYLAFQAADYGAAIRHSRRAEEAAVATGQLRRAIVYLMTVSASFANLGDKAAALEWAQRALARARECGWPASIGTCLTNIGETLRELGRLDAAAESLDEALVHLRTMSGSRNEALALHYRGWVHLDQGQPQAALALLERLAERARCLDLDELLGYALTGRARAHLELQAPQAALADGHAALELARTQQVPDAQIDALKILADVHLAFPQVDDPQVGSGLFAARARLEAALALAGTISELPPPAEILETLAHCHAELGEPAVAYALAVRAARSREQAARHEQAQRTVAAEVRLDTERARAEAARQRVLADAAEERARALAVAHEALQARNEELERVQAALAEASVTDPLTGMHNRRFLHQTIDADAALAVRAHQQREAAQDADLVLLLIDLDHFKQLNDHHGHAAGDLVLAALHARLRAVLRAGDRVVRWGGEEVLVLARGVARVQAPHIATRLLDSVCRVPFAIGEGKTLAVTASLGWSVFPFDTARPEIGHWADALALADAALYRAKGAGRATWRGLVAAPDSPGVAERCGASDPAAALAAGALREQAPPP